MDKVGQNNTLTKFGGQRVYSWQHTLLGGLGACIPRKFFNLDPLRLPPVHFFQTICGFKMAYLTPIIIVHVKLVLIRHLGVIAE